MTKTKDLRAGNVRLIHTDVTPFGVLFNRTPVFFSFSMIQFFSQHGGVTTATTALQVGPPAAARVRVR